MCLSTLRRPSARPSKFYTLLVVVVNAVFVVLLTSPSIHPSASSSTRCSISVEGECLIGIQFLVVVLVS